MSSPHEPQATSKLASIVIPAYNAADHITACIEALTKQSIPSSRFEIIVVDDGSTDNTREVLEALPVSTILQANQGPAGARNTGAAAATGEFILFIDSDCVASPDWLEQMLKPFENPEVVGVSGAYRTRQRELVARFAQLEFEERYRMLARKPFIDMIASHAAAYRRRTFIESGGFVRELRMNEDVELSYRLSAQSGKLVFNPLAIIYHFHPATCGRYFRIKIGRGYWRIMVYKEFPHKAVADTYTPQNLKYQVLSIYLLAFCLLLAPFIPYFLFVAGGIVVLSSATMLTMCANVARTSPGMGLVCLPMLWVRALALALGSATAVMRIAMDGLRARLR
ncbi:MAG: glycosyltransferase [Gammaproteobacteria bacterium]|nr:glycosyltransferase [Gammaproteobacteria bacterium]